MPLLATATWRSWPISRVQSNSGMQRLPLSGEVAYGSLYSVTLVIFHCFYRNEEPPLVYKSTQVHDACGWVVKSTAGSRNSVSRLLAMSQHLLSRRHWKTRTVLGNYTLLFSAFCQDIYPTSFQI